MTLYAPPRFLLPHPSPVATLGAPGLGFLLVRYLLVEVRMGKGAQTPSYLKNNDPFTMTHGNLLQKKEGNAKEFRFFYRITYIYRRRSPSLSLYLQTLCQ
jgi:hypothetical protein